MPHPHCRQRPCQEGDPHIGSLSPGQGSIPRSTGSGVTAPARRSRLDRHRLTAPPRTATSARMSTTTRSPPSRPAQAGPSRWKDPAPPVLRPGGSPWDVTSCSDPKAAGGEVHRAGRCGRPPTPPGCRDLGRHTRRSPPGGPGPFEAPPGGCRTRPLSGDRDPAAPRWGRPRPGRQSSPTPVPNSRRPAARDPGWGTKYHTVTLDASLRRPAPHCWETDHRCLAMRVNATPSPTPVRTPSAFGACDAGSRTGPLDEGGWIHGS